MHGYPTGDRAGPFRYFRGLRSFFAVLAVTALFGAVATGALAHGPGDKGKGKGPATEVQATGHPDGVHPEVKRFDVTGEGMPSVRGPFPDTVNMEWLGQVTNADMGLNRLVYSGASFLSDIWGWTSPDEPFHEYAIFGTTSGMAFVCVTDPTDPKFLGIIPTTDSGTQLNWWYDVKVYDDHAYWVTEVRNAGVGIKDLNELACEAVDPGTPIEATARWGVDENTGVGPDPDTGYVRAHNISVNSDPDLDKPYLYLTGITREGATHQNGIMVLEIDGGDPTILTLKALIEGEDVDSHDAQIVTYGGPDPDYLGQDILLNFNGGELNVQIWDVTDLTDIDFVHDFTYPGAGFTHQGGFAADTAAPETKGWILVGDEEDELFGLSDPRNPDLPDTARTHICKADDLDTMTCEGADHSSYDSDAASIDHNLFVKGDKVYQAHYTAGIRVLQISDDNGTLTLSEIAHMDTEPRIPNENLNWGYNIWIGPWGVYPFFDSGTIAASDGLNGLVLMRLTPED